MKFIQLIRTLFAKHWLGISVFSGIAVYILVMGTTGSCPMCSAVTNAVGLGKGQQPVINIPVIATTDLNGVKVNSADWQGDVAVVTFWATWCGPCKRELPELEMASKSYASRGVRFVGILQPDDSRQAAQSFIAQKGINFPIVFDPGNLTAGFGGISAVPTLFLIGRDGKIAGRYEGGLGQAQLAKELDLLLNAIPAKA